MVLRMELNPVTVLTALTALTTPSAQRVCATSPAEKRFGYG